MTTLFKQRIFCITENVWVPLWQSSQTLLTTCPNNVAHTVQAGSADILTQQVLGNEGGGAQVFDTTTDVDPVLRTLAGTANGLIITQNATTITVDNTLTGSNLGAGAGTVFSAKSGASLQFNSLAGTTGGLTVSAPAGGVITIDNTLTGSNLGAGAGTVFSAKVGAVLQFNSLAGGSGITVSAPAANTITISITAPVSVALGGTNSTTALSNGRVMISSGGKIAEATTVFSTGGNIQIGTQSFVVQPNFVYAGADADTSGTAGPYSVYYTSASSNPIFEILPYSADNIHLAWDAYWKTNTWSASGASNPMRINKTGSAIFFDHGNTPGAGSAITWTAALKVDGTGQVTVGPTGTKNYPTSLMIRGTDSNQLTGPGIQTYTTVDAYPLVQILSHLHNNIAITFDAAFNAGTTTWKSSSSLANFQIYSQGTGNLVFLAASGFAQGADITWTPALTISSASVLTDSAGNVITGQALTTVSANSTGAIIRPFIGLFYKRGNVVTLRLRDNTGAANTAATNAVSLVGFIPAGLQPASIVYYFSGLAYGGFNVMVNIVVNVSDINIWLVTSTTSIGNAPFISGNAFQGGVHYLTWTV
jgi:hypothetical protein